MGFADGGPVRIMINIYCLLILTLIFCLVYSLYRFLSGFMVWRTEQVVGKPFWYILDKIILFLFIVSLIGTVFFSTLFVLSYLFWKLMNKIGFGFVINNAAFFKDCWDTGLFPFLDKLSEITYGNDTISARMRNSIFAISDFLKTFMKEAFGIVFEGYEIDDEYLTAAVNAILFNHLYADDEQKCSEMKNKFIEMSKSKTPIIKISYDAPPPKQRELSALENIELQNCIKNHTMDIPNDATTIDSLKLILSNAIAKQNCYLGIQNNTSQCPKDLSCTIDDIENSVYNSVQNVSKSLFEYGSSKFGSATSYYTKTESQMKDGKDGGGAKSA